MLTTEDIKKLTEYLKEAFKEVFATKEDINKLDAKVNNLQTSIDALAVDKKTNSDEIQVLNHRVEKAEDWIEEAAPAVGVKFDR